MYAIEFEAKVSDGTIKIPDKYINKLDSRVKVIILTVESDEKKLSNGFDSVKIKTKGFKFDREVANER